MSLSDFRDLDEFLTPAAKQLPVSGTVWTFPARIDARSGALALRMQAAAQAARGTGTAMQAAVEGVVDPADAQHLYDQVMGGVDEQMLAAGIPVEHTTHVFQTLLVWHLHGRDAAVRAWSPGEAPAPNRATRRGTGTATKKASAGTKSRPQPKG